MQHPHTTNPIHRALDVIETTVPAWLRDWTRQELQCYADSPVETVPDSVLCLANDIADRYESQFPAPLLDGLRRLANNFGPGAVILAAASMQDWPVYDRLVNTQKETHKAAIDEDSHESELAKALNVDATVSSWSGMLELTALYRQQAASVDTIVAMHRELAGARGVDPDRYTWQELIAEVNSGSD